MQHHESYGKERVNRGHLYIHHRHVHTRKNVLSDSSAVAAVVGSICLLLTLGNDSISPAAIYMYIYIYTYVRKIAWESVRVTHTA